jgi:hypothetical protein
MVASTLHCIVFLLTAWENESGYTERQTDRVLPLGLQLHCLGFMGTPKHTIHVAQNLAAIHSHRVNAGGCVPYNLNGSTQIHKAEKSFEPSPEHDHEVLSIDTFKQLWQRSMRNWPDLW